VIGSTISHFEILDRLGGGERSAVCKARDLRVDRLVRLRLLSSSNGPLDRPASTVADPLARLSHPHICAVRESGETEDGRLFLAMAWYEGQTLEERLLHGPLPPEVAIDLSSQIASGLAMAHKRGIVHRRLEPASILVTTDGRAKILDFGLADLAGPEASSSPYRAPEQRRGEAGDARSDVWALGVVLYDMIAGRLPFRGGAEEPDPLPPLPDQPLSLELERIVDRALSRRPEDRYQEMEDLLLELLALVGTGALPGRAAETAASLATPSSRTAPREREPERPPTAIHEGGATLRPSGMIGRTIYQYRILEHLGGGGMGVVYKAEDTRLERTVALKFLPPELTRDPVAKARFLQEARAASALDHPNICTIHEVGETDDGQLFLAMTCYDGETLKRKIERGPLPIDEAVDIAKQIAQGLTKAHRLGIVHRDIKPANIIITSDGIVKILDFGLAKLAGAAGLTRAGFCLGTPAYMSPEQARGEVDHRTDLWSLGVVLYEMVTGAPPFTGDTDQAIIYSLLSEEPKPLSALRPEVPADLERVLKGMLAKDPGDRYPTVEIALADLRILSGSTTSGTIHSMPAFRRRRLRTWMKAALAAAAVLAAVAAWYLLRPAAPLDFTSSTLTDQAGSELFPSLAPDGDVFVYAKLVNGAGNFDIFWQRIDGGSPRNLTEDSRESDTQPAFSPDGKQIAFRSERDGGGLFVMGATGESPRRLTSGFGYNPAWSPDGREIVYATEGVLDPLRRSTAISGLWRVRVSDGFRTLVTKGDAVQPSWSPHGKRIAYWGIPEQSTRRVIWTLPVEGGAPVPAVDDGFINWNPIWSPDGRYLYYVSDRDGTVNLWRVRIDEGSGRVSGDPEPLRTPSSWSGMISISKDGRHIVYAARDNRSNVEQIPFDPVEGMMTEAPRPVTSGSSRLVRSGDVSPDGQWLAYDTSVPQEDLFIVRMDGTGPTQLTNDPDRDRVPRWSPDGERILFYSNRGGKYEAWTIRRDGSGLQRISGEGVTLTDPIWSPDGRRIVYAREDEDAPLEMLDLDMSGQPARPLPGLKSGLYYASSWSPDGTRLAGILSRETGQVIAIYSLDTGRLQPLAQRANGVVWLDDHRLVYLDQGSLFLLDTRNEQSRKLLSPQDRSRFTVVSVARDGRALYVVSEIDEGDVKMLEMR
jgi:serine/threonine protein kinase/Tol biopolymer transport system component